jgi:hypothetical protein
VPYIYRECLTFPKYTQGDIMADLQFEIVKHYGVIATEKTGWKKELNMVSWNSRSPKLDVRDWAPGHDKMGKGITLSAEEACRLSELLAGACK